MIAYYTLWAHQIKTPIAAMKLTLQYEDSHLARQISGDLFRIEQYVEMVMMFLRLGSTSTDYVIREYELTPILNQTIKNLPANLSCASSPSITSPWRQRC